jgi:hypothetical protein
MILIDEATKECLTKIANELYHHDFPMQENHFKPSDIEYVVKASYVFMEASKKIKPERKVENE